MNNILEEKYESIEIQTAGKLNLITGIICLVLSLGFVSVYFELFLKEELITAIGISYLLLMMHFMISAMTYVLLKSYKERESIKILIVPKEGTIDFDEINKYYHIKHVPGNMCLIKNEDYKKFLYFDIFQDLSAYVN